MTQEGARGAVEQEKKGRGAGPLSVWVSDGEGKEDFESGGAAPAALGLLRRSNPTPLTPSLYELSVFFRREARSLSLLGARRTPRCSDPCVPAGFLGLRCGRREAHEDSNRTLTPSPPFSSARAMGRGLGWDPLLDLSGLEFRDKTWGYESESDDDG